MVKRMHRFHERKDRLTNTQGVVDGQLILGSIELTVKCAYVLVIM